MKDELAKAIWAKWDATGSMDDSAGDCADQASAAVHSFLGAEKGKELKRNAMAQMVAALRKAVRACIDVHRSATQNPALTCAGWCPSYTGACLYWKALRAAGEEVEGG